jgi:hypothetical protein
MRLTVATLDSDSYRDISDVTTPPRIAWCETHGYNLVRQRHPGQANVPLRWLKFAMMLDLLADCDWCLWMDADTIITNPVMKPPMLSGDADVIVAERFDTGVLLIRSNSRGRQVLKTAMRQTDLMARSDGDDLAIKCACKETQARLATIPDCLLNSVPPVYGVIANWQPSDLLLHVTSTQPWPPARLPLLWYHALGRPGRKVINIGLARTGTKSVAVALSLLGLSVTHAPGTCSSIAAYAAATEVYSPIERLEELYPGSLYIFTTRPLDEWVSSLLRLQQRLVSLPVTIMPDFFWHLDPPRWLAMYEQRLVEARALVGERLLVFSVMDGWGPLCRFLDRPVPPVQFPHFDFAKQDEPPMLGP